MPGRVVTVCDRAHEELEPGPGWLHWSVADPVPVGTKAAFDATVVELRERIGVRARPDAVGIVSEDLAHLPETGTGWLGADLTRRLAAEALGTGLLIVAVVGSGIMASRLSPDDIGIQLLENAAATAAALIGLILIFAAVSGAHFNPVVTLVDRAFGTTTSNKETGLYITAQVVGACLGTMLANVMFELPAVEWSTKSRSSRRAVALRGRRDRHPVARHPRLRPHGAGERGSVRGGDLDRRRVLVHVVDELREPCGHHRPHDDRHLRGHQAIIGADVHRDAVGRRGDRFRAGTSLLSGNAQEQRMSEPPAVLFLCVHNAGRSQMAAGWLRHLAGNQVVVWSGGSEPASSINPSAIEAMAEVGIDIRAEFPKPWTDEIVRAADVVVTMGCGDACPLFPGKRYEDWALEDPAGQDVAAVRVIRDEIRARVEALIASLDIPTRIA